MNSFPKASFHNQKDVDHYKNALSRGERIYIQNVGELKAFLEASNLSDDEPIQLEVRVGNTTYCGHTDYDVPVDELPPHMSKNVYKKNEIEAISIPFGIVFQIKNTGTVVGR